MDKNKKAISSKDGNEVIIRNKFRENNLKTNPAPYQPEHERLGIKPIIYPVNRNDFIQKKTKSQQEKPNNPPFVHSGQNNDLVWNKLPSEEEEEERYNRDILFDEVPLPPESESEFGDKETSSLEDTDIDNVLLSDLKVGDYVLLHKNYVISIGSREKIEEAMRDMLLENDGLDETKKSIFDDLAIFKRVDIKAGVFIDDNS